MRFSKHYLAAFIAFVIWGFFSLALKPLHNYASLDILFYRVFFCAVIMLVISLFVRRDVLHDNIRKYKAMSDSDKQRAIGVALGGGVLLTANWFFFIYVMNHISVKAASFAYMVCPILTTVIAFFALNERLSKWQWTAVGVSVVSCLLLSFNSLADVMYSMIVALSYAIYLVSQRRNPGIDKLLILTIQVVFAALILLPMYPAYSEGIPTEPIFYVLILIIAVIFTIIPLYLNLYALAEVPSSTMGILLYINPLMNFSTALFYFHESITPLQIVAYSLIVASIVLFNEKHLFRRSATVAG